MGNLTTTMRSAPLEEPTGALMPKYNGSVVWLG